MRLPSLMRRHQIWLPTVWGWLALSLVCAATLLFAVRNVYPFLAPQRPVGARLLVVEGWMPVEELDQALRLVQAGGYERVLTSGGPTEDGFEREEAKTYAERARTYLVRRGLPADLVVAIPAPDTEQDRTYLNAVMARDWVTQSGVRVDALDVFSSGAHSRRTWLLHSIVFGPRVRVGIISAKPDLYDATHWWRTSDGTKAVLTEGIAWLWTELFFHPSPPGSPEEKWEAE